MTPTESVFSDIRERVHLYDSLPDRFLALDTETTGTRLHHGHKPFAVSACNQDGTTFFWRCPVDPKTREPQWKKKQLEEIVALVLSYDYFVFHNAKFDIRALSKIPGLRKAVEHIIRLAWKYVRDTLLYSHVMDSQEEHKLKTLAAKYVGIPKDDQTALQAATEAARRRNKKAGNENAEELEWDYWLVGKELDEYAVLDAKRTALLYAMYVEAVRELDQQHFSLTKAARTRQEKTVFEIGLAWQVCREHLLMPQVYAMEEKGVRIRRTTTLQKLGELRTKAEQHQATVLRIAAQDGFKDLNTNSPVQLRKLLYEKWGLPIPHFTKPKNPTTEPSPSTDADALEILSFRSPQKRQKDFCQNLLDSRMFSTSVKYLDEYARKAIPEGKLPSDQGDFYVLHSNVNQSGTGTTRFSMSDPNNQNVSKDKDLAIRACFGPRPGCYWLDADYNNLEMRILAWDSGEKRLIKLFEEGGSYHLLIAEILFGPMKKWKGYNPDDWKSSIEYKQTKNGNFARGYGAGQYTTDKTYKLDGAYEKLKNEFKYWTKHNERMIEEAKTKGYVETLFGYRLAVNPNRAFTTALNYRIQGTAGCVMKYAMLGFNKQQTSGDMVLTVHDELITEWEQSQDRKKAALAMREAMEAPGKAIGIPLPAEISYVPVKWNKPEAVAA